MQSFNGDEGGWREWQRDFKSCLGSCSAVMVKAMELAEKEVYDVAAKTVKDQDKMWRGISRRSSEMYNILRMGLGGEPKLIIETVKEGDGLRAWQVLSRRYGKMTLAKVLRKYSV